MVVMMLKINSSGKCPVRAVKSFVIMPLLPAGNGGVLRRPDPWCQWLCSHCLSSLGWAILGDWFFMLSLYSVSFFGPFQFYSLLNKSRIILGNCQKAAYIKSPLPKPSCPSCFLILQTSHFEQFVYLQLVPLYILVLPSRIFFLCHPFYCLNFLLKYSMFFLKGNPKNPVFSGKLFLMPQAKACFNFENIFCFCSSVLHKMDECQ